MSVSTPTAMAREAQRERAISSQRTAVVRTSAPPPPYFSSYSTPRKPSAPIRGQIDFGISPASPHASTCGSTSFCTKVRTVCRNISCCSSKIFTPPSRGPPGLDRVAVDQAVGAARQRLAEHHHVRPLEARDLRPHEVGHLLGGVPTGLRDLDHRLDRLAPLHVGDAVDTDPGHARHLHDHRLDLGGIHVLPARLDQLLLGLALDVVEIAVVVEPAHVPGMVPAVAEG